MAEWQRQWSERDARLNADSRYASGRRPWAKDSNVPNREKFAIRESDIGVMVIARGTVPRPLRWTVDLQNRNKIEPDHGLSLGRQHIEAMALFR